MIRRILLALSLPLCACTKMGGLQWGTSNTAMFSQGDSALAPASDMLTTSCATRSDFDACIYLKNPVAQRGAAVSESDLTTLLQFGVKIRDLEPTGNLQNAHFQVRTLNTPRLQVVEAAQFKADFSESTSYIEQVMAYYWADRVFEYLAPRLGASRLPVQGLTIYADDVFTGFSSRAFAISLEKISGQIPKALSGEVVVQLLGQALAHSLSRGKVFDSQNSAQHNSCGMSNKGCCTTASGCSNALASSFGDYLAGIMFPNQPVLGETVADLPSGQSVCGMNRDLQALSSSSEVAIFSTCGGNITLEGSWYASLWWSIRTQAEANQPGASQDIDILFFDHAQSWTATSTFNDAKQAAITLATNYKSGQYLTLIQNVLGSVN